MFQVMPKNAKGSSGPGRRGTGSHKSKKTHKVSVRQQFLTRHIDQVWEDVRKTASVHDGKTGPMGTTSRLVWFAQPHTGILEIRLPCLSPAVIKPLRMT